MRGAGLVGGWALMAMCTAAPPEVVVSTGEYAPWTSEKRADQGFVNRVVAEAFRREGMSVRFQYYPWRRTLEVLRAGRADASSFWFDDAERVREFLYSDPVSEHRELLFHRKNLSVPKWSALEDLAAFRFGATRGYTYTRAFWQLAGDGILTVEESADDESNFRKLLAGRIDLFPMDEVSGWQMLASPLFPEGTREQVTAESRPLSLQYGHVLMRRTPDGRRLLKAFNDGLARMKTDGTYERFREDIYRGAKVER